MTPLALLLVLTAAPDDGWQARLRQERDMLRAEAAELSKALEAAKRNSEATRGAVEKGIEQLTRALARLRAENNARSQGLVGKERAQSRARQPAQALEAAARAAGWARAKSLLSESAAPIDDETAAAAAMTSIASNIAARGQQRVVHAPVFDDTGAGTKLAVLLVGEVGAIARDKGGRVAAVEPVAGGQGWHVVGEWTRVVERPAGVVLPMVAYDPEVPHEHAEEGAEGVREWIEAGGIVMYPLLLMALLAALVALERVARLVPVYLTWRRLARDAEPSCEDDDWVSAPLRIVLARDGDRASLEERAAQAVVRLRGKVRARLTVLGVIGATAPLLGLLGTVSGMIGTFRVITEHGTGDPELLSGGISQALLTTQLGLAVAIPTLLVHAGLLRWAARLVSTAELTALKHLHAPGDARAREDAS